MAAKKAPAKKDTADWLRKSQQAFYKSVDAESKMKGMSAKFEEIKEGTRKRVESFKESSSSMRKQYWQGVQTYYRQLEFFEEKGV